jgi:hypothetical protein
MRLTRSLIIAAALALCAAPSLAQSQATPPPAASAPTARAADPADVGSVDAILGALYATISGDKGVARDWTRFETLFHPDARMISAGRTRAGEVRARARMLQDFIAGSTPLMEGDGFHEVEIFRTTQRLGTIIHVTSTYEARHALSDAQPFLRGVNSIQLFDDGQRLWILNVAWSPETPENPIPAEFLPPAR